MCHNVPIAGGRGVKYPAGKRTVVTRQIEKILFLVSRKYNACPSWGAFLDWIKYPLSQTLAKHSQMSHKLLGGINLIMSTCYMCNQEATSVEHAPPICVFPAKKDLPSQKDYRKNLITVPSCATHNAATSNDDEYLLYVLSSSITSSDVGLNQFLTKVKRSAERRRAG